MKQSTKESMVKLKLEFTNAVKDKKRWLLCGLEILIIVLLIVFDMLTKKYIYGYCDANRDVIIFNGVLRFTAVTNTGAGFGMLKGKTSLLTIISFISSLILIGLVFYSYNRRNKWLRSSFVLIIAGAVGNLIDRMFLGYVRDFVYFELIDFAVFNFADSFLTIGTILLIIYVIFFYSKDEEALAKKRLALQNKSCKEDDLLVETEVDTTETTEVVETEAIEKTAAEVEETSGYLEEATKEPTDSEREGK